ncbi:MAG: branched-chain amino acid transaminase [Xanthomonadales bacterium]|nr:branched-chain amino acid transaminase [Xanthomonadales bacterium]
MSIQYPPYIWQNGEMKAWADGTTHVMAHALHYGSSVFEGIRAYATPDGPRILKLTEHLERLYVSARMYDMKIGYSMSELRNACFDLLEKNQLGSAYLRPIAFRGLGAFGLGADNPVEVAIGAWEWGPYLGAEAVKQGVSACVSSWRRLAPNTIPTLAKAGGNYLSSILISREARARGCAEGIGLGVDGNISEGAGENMFLIIGGKVITPPMTASILLGITRGMAIEMAREAGYEVLEQALPREALYIADEIFMTGTAAEVTPVVEVDGKAVGDGKPGPVTRAVQERFFGVLEGRLPDSKGWLESR